MRAKYSQAEWAGIGLVLGTALGAAFGNVGLGVAFGLIVGACVGAVSSKKPEPGDRDDG